MWLSSAFSDVDLRPRDEVTAQQMTSLFAEVKRPNADAITRD